MQYPYKYACQTYQGYIIQLRTYLLFRIQVVFCHSAVHYIRQEPFMCMRPYTVLSKLDLIGLIYEHIIGHRMVQVLYAI